MIEGDDEKGRRGVIKTRVFFIRQKQFGKCEKNEYNIIYKVKNLGCITFIKIEIIYSQQ